MFPNSQGLSSGLQSSEEVLLPTSPGPVWKNGPVIGLWCLLGKDFHFWIQQKPGDVQQVSLFWNQICDLIQTIWDLQVAIARLLFSSHFCTFFGGQLPRQCGFLCRWYPGSQPEHSSGPWPTMETVMKSGADWPWRIFQVIHGGWTFSVLSDSYCWWFQKSGEKTRLRLLVYPIVYRVCYMPSGFLGFLNHQQ